MKNFFILFFLFFLITLHQDILSQQFRFNDLILQKEENPSLYFAAKREAVKQNLPVSIIIPGEVLADVIIARNGVVYYSVINNFANPGDGGRILSCTEVQRSINFQEARLIYGNGRIVDNSGVPLIEKGYSSTTKLLLVANSSNDNIGAFDPVTGDLVNVNFVNPDPTNLGTPKHAMLNPEGFISISDQIKDLVQKYDTGGVYMQIYAPAGGVNTAILDNIRGHGYHPANGDLLVTVGSSGNANAVARFDKSGNFVGNFIAPAGGGLNSPFAVTPRENDILVASYGNDKVIKYDFNGNFIGDFCTGINSPEQITLLPGGNIAVAVFSTPSGLAIYDSAGNQLNFFTSVAGLRGVYPLGSGTYMVTNGAGVHEINKNGELVRTIYVTTGAQYVDLADYSIIPVELTSFTSNVSGRTVDISWSTATEINNRGFEVERSFDNSSFENIAFISGAGTSAEKHSYSFTDIPEFNGVVYYRLKQMDYDGSFEYSNVIEADLSIPLEFSVNQNYPNPFNPVTNIKFSIPSDELVRLEIFNTIGQLVKTIQSGIYSVGTHSTSFDASGMNSGVYYYKVTAGNYSAVNKMILMK